MCVPIKTSHLPLQNECAAAMWEEIKTICHPVPGTQLMISASVFFQMSMMYDLHQESDHEKQRVFVMSTPDSFTGMDYMRILHMMKVASWKKDVDVECALVGESRAYGLYIAGE